MYYNRFPDRNIGFIPYAQAILRMLDNERLAISPIQLNLKLERGSKMKNQETVVDIPREVQSRSLLHHKVGVCPQCEGDMYVVSTKKAFGKVNQACECIDCHYSENR